MESEREIGGVRGLNEAVGDMGLVVEGEDLFGGEERHCGESMSMRYYYYKCN